LFHKTKLDDAQLVGWKGVESVNLNIPVESFPRLYRVCSALSAAELWLYLLLSYGWTRSLAIWWLCGS